MLSVIQLVTHASVLVGSLTVASIENGMLALVGIEKTDTTSNAEALFHRMRGYRIFRDAQGKTNQSLEDCGGGLLLVPQFTLVADTTTGNRPSFSKGMAANEARALFKYLVDFARENYPYVATGQFSAHMQVTLCNDGPSTFMLSS